MKNKYSFLLSLKSLEYEIKELSYYSKVSSDCFELLQIKLDHLCKFMICEENEKQWRIWGNHEEIKVHSEQLRGTSSQALCDVEKYQSICILNKKLNISDYISILSNSVKEELVEFHMDNHSKVLFIGSGAFPLSALTIAKEAGAVVLCLDHDAEAVELGREVAEISGLGSKVHFSGSSVQELSYLKETTHILIASLVNNKLEIVNDLKNRINVNASVIIRYGNGLKSIFNYPLQKDLSAEWNETRICRSKSIYDTLILHPKKYMAKSRLFPIPN